MKKISFFLMLAGITITCFSQQKKSVPKWVSDRGYWIIESNRKMPKKSTIYFYTNDNVMVYQEKVEGLKLKTARQKTLVHLKQVLEQTVTAWEKGIKINDTGLLVATPFKK